MKKTRGWKIGKLSQDLRSMGGSTLIKGTEVQYKRIKTVSDDEEFNFKLTDYEWHYKTDNNLIRTIELTIEGEPNIKEKIK